MSIRGSARISIGSRELALELPRVYLSAQGSLKLGGAELWLSLEGRSLTIDVRRVGWSDLLTRPRDVMDRVEGLEELAKGLADLGYRVEIRVRGLKVLSAKPPRSGSR